MNAPPPPPKKVRVLLQGGPHALDARVDAALAVVPVSDGEYRALLVHETTDQLVDMLSCVLVSVLRGPRGAEVFVRAVHMMRAMQCEESETKTF